MKISSRLAAAALSLGAIAMALLVILPHMSYN